MKLLNPFFALFILVSLTSCIKDVEDVEENRFDADCEAIKKAKINVAKSTYYAGDSINFSTTKIINAQYSWQTSSSRGDVSISEKLFIGSCTKGDQAWYFLSIGSFNCDPKFDSVYITVINKPVDAPCSPAKNMISFSSLENISTANAVLSIDRTVNFKKIRISQGIGYPTMEIFFPQYWNDKEFEDGVYITQATLDFGSNVYGAQMSVTDQSIYFVAHPGKIYLSHVNGKLRIVFCNITLTGSLGGPTFTTTAASDFTLK